jgi:hypothetical protein
MGATILPLRRRSWHHAGRMAKGVESREILESGPDSDRPVSGPVPPPRPKRDLAADAKFYWPAVLVGVGLIVQWVDMRNQVKEVRDEIARFEKYTEGRFEGKTQYPTFDPGAHAPPSSSAATKFPLPQETSSAAPSTPDESVAPEDPRRFLRTIPSSIATHDPPVCVTKSGHRRIHCEAATKCVGPEAFKPEFFQKIRDEAGVDGPMFVCDEIVAAPGP